MGFEVFAAAPGPGAARLAGHRPSALKALIAALPLLSLLASTGCAPRMLKMPTPEVVPSAAGQIIEVGSVGDERSQSVLGRLDTLTIDSGPDLLSYVEDELTNSLSRLGFAVRKVERDTPLAGRKRILASLLSAEVSSESTLRFPVVAAIRLRVELIDESSQSTFRKEIRGAASRNLGFHAQGGPEDAKLLAEVIDRALSRLAADESFVVAVRLSPAEAAKRRAVESRVRSAARSPRSSGVVEEGESAESIAGRLADLDRLLAEGLIDQADYDQKRRRILDEL